MSHLGIGGDNESFLSTDLIKNTNGINVVLDGHSHSVIECDRVKNKDGMKVLLSSTGTQFESFGLLYITKEGNISTGLIKDYATKDETVSTYIASIQAQYAEKLKQKIGHTNYDLTILDPTTKERIVRKKETNLGDLCADAFKKATGADIAILNSGGIRTSIPSGDITYGDVISVMPFNNKVCEVSVSGQTILDALEMSVRLTPGEFGGFLQVSGMTFELDASIATPVTVDGKGIFVSLSGERRVKNVKVGTDTLDPTKNYNLVSTSYTLKSMGDGYTMFNDSTIIFDEDVLDNQVLIDYIQNDMEGEVSEIYQNPYGQSRIVDVTK